MLNKSRLTFIKTAAYTSVLAVPGAAELSALASASENMTQDQRINTEIVTLINHTASTVTLDNISGIAITDLNDESTVSIAPGEESSFIVAAINSKNGSANNKNLYITDVMMGGQLAINSDYPEFNGIYPQSVFETQAS